MSRDIDSSEDADILPEAPPADSPSTDKGKDEVKIKPEPAEPLPPKETDSKDVKDIKDLFDSDDDDSLMAGVNEADLLAAEEAKPKPVIRETVDPQVQLAFYQRLFPWRQLFQWLNHSPIPCNDFTHREFAFELFGGAYVRYQSFPTSDLMRKEVLRMNPARFEIGPVYSANPRDRKSLRKAAFKPLEKELVFDIDLTDYDDVRTCCDKANICNKCWNFITVAIKIIEAALRDDLGFKHIMWVYSGRRGAHAWVCDKRARQMDDERRRAVASYIEVIRGGNQGGKQVQLRRPFHPHISRSLNVLKDNFVQDILRDQDPWRTNESAEKLLKLIPDKTLAESLRRTWASDDGRPSLKKWSDINELAEVSANVSNGFKPKELKEAREDIVFEYMYPRLDVAVSKHLNHLLKSPFVIHPGTGRVCVPIDASKAEEFDPLNVPKVYELLEEIDEYGVGVKSEAGEEGGVQDYEKTSLKPYIDFFKKFVVGVLRDEQATVKRERDVGVKAEAEAMEF